MQKTNAVRLLDTLGVTYKLLEYTVDPDNLAAELTAEKVNRPPEQVFKTLVARGDRQGVCLAVIPGNAHLDLKALALAMGDRKVETVSLKEVQPLTGYIRGGVTALACKKAYPVYLDEIAEIFDLICVSAGIRGMLIELNPADYLRAVNGILAAIS
jgi:Cys-tRNA(Pro)/Cys-tRNA(Cys) deacylase